MSKVSKFINGRRWLRNLLVGVLVVVTIGGVIGGVVALARNTEKIEKAFKYKSISSTSYKVGGLDENGDYMKSDASIYSKKPFACQGLTITPDFDASVSYQVFFYDSENKLAHKTSVLTGAFLESEVPFFAKSARIVITPRDDDKVSVFEVLKYAKMLDVKVLRDQNFKDFSADFFEKDTTLAQSSCGGGLDSSTGALNPNGGGNWVSVYMDVSAYKELLISTRYGYSNVLCFYDAGKVFIESKVIPVDSKLVEDYDGLSYNLLDFSDLENVKYVRIAYSISVDAPIPTVCGR